MRRKAAMRPARIKLDHLRAQFNYKAAEEADGHGNSLKTSR
jgi:hypothetical protein